MRLISAVVMQAAEYLGLNGLTAGGVWRLDEINFGPKHDFRLPSRRWLIVVAAMALIAASATVIMTGRGGHRLPRRGGPSICSRGGGPHAGRGAGNAPADPRLRHGGLPG